MLASVRQKIERTLFRRGFSSPEVRSLLCTQSLVTAFSLGVGIPLALLTYWGLLFASGAAIGLLSLWQIARFAEASIFQVFTIGLGLKLFACFTLRFVFTAFILVALVIWLKAPLVPLIAGLTSPVAIIVLWGLTRLTRKTVKEA